MAAMLTRMRDFGFVCCALALLASCGGAPQTPEQQVRALIQQATAAAEERSVSKLRDMISERYTDEQQRDRRAIEQVLRFHFLRNTTIHLLTRVPDITITAPDHALATVYVAMAGVPISSVDDLPALRADLHHFELEFTREENGWRLQRATWQRAEPAEFVTS